jgi:hypothetical protein
MIRLATILVALALAGTAFGQDPQSPPRDPMELLPDGTTLSENPVLYTSESDDFQVVFPGGCGQLNVRTNEPDLWGGETFDDIVQVQYVYCDRNQEQGEGCSITGIYNWHDQDGIPAGPDQVVRRVRETLAKFGAEVVSQNGVKRRYNDFYAVEGLDVQAKAPEGPGEIRVMGLLSDGDVYVLAAWNIEGGLTADEQMTGFFNSFQPFVDPE